MVADILESSEAQAREDFELLESLTDQVARDGAEHLLPVLSETAPAFNTDTRELIDSILIAGEREVGTRGAENTGVAVERAAGSANQRVLDLVDIVSVCRAERSSWAELSSLRAANQAVTRLPRSVPESRRAAFMRAAGRWRWRSRL